VAHCYKKILEILQFTIFRSKHNGQLQFAYGFLDQVLALSFDSGFLKPKALVIGKQPHPLYW